MAESRSAKAKRWLRRDFTKSELQGIVGILVADQIIDVATGGRLSAMKKTALKRIVLPLAARGTAATGSTAGRIAMTGLRGAKMIAMRHPVLTAGAVTYYAYKNREEIGDLVEQGYEILSPIGEAIQERLPEVPRPGIGLPVRRPTMEMGDLLGGLSRMKPRVRAKSTFNKAVAKGMAEVKKSKFMGKPGIISNPKKAFTTVTKTVAQVKKTGKVAKSGIKRKIGLAVRKLWKRFRR
jgi:hypothetical protein